MEWWEDDDDIFMSDEEFDALEDFEDDLDFEDGLVFKNRDELAQMGHSLYSDMIHDTSNKGEKARIVENYQKSNEKYTDKQFPPDSTSLVKDWGLLDFHTQKEWRRFVWKRSDEIFKHPIKVFDEISPNDINQGQLGDCYFLSTLSAIAEFPGRIKKLFDTQEHQPSGCYTVNICDMGVWCDVVVDDFFPCTPDGQVAFSGPEYTSGTTELWVLLLEKAWAKRFGSYWAIDAGLTEEALKDLTGGPCFTVNSDEEDLWDKIYDSNKKNFIITAASAGDDGCGDMVNDVGLVALHAYAVIDAREVKTRAGLERILEIRNPWGEQEWTGDWSDKSDKWTPELKKELGWENSDDGRFWMPIKDFVNFFSNVTICCVHDDYQYQGIQKNQPQDGSSIFKVSLEEGGMTYFMVTQMDARRFDEDCEYDYSPVRIILARVEDGELVFLKGYANAFERDVWISEEVEPGEYLVYVQIDWIGDFTDQFGFSVYSGSKVKLSDVSFQEVNFLQRVFSVETAESEGAKVNQIGPDMYFYQVMHIGDDGEGNFMEGCIYDIVVNDSKNSRLELDVIHKTFENMELLEPYEGDSYFLKLDKGESKVVVKRQVSLLESNRITMSLRKKIIRI